jgi:Protein of unknown function (DUF3592)
MHGFFVFLAFGLLGGVSTFLVWQDYLLFRRPRIRTTGTVIGHRTSEDDGSTFYCSRILFADQYGKPHEFTDSYGRAVPKPDIGTEIAVIYPRDDPRHARVPRPVLRLILYCFLFGMAALLIANEIGLMR